MQSQAHTHTQQRFKLKGSSQVLVSGRAIGQKIGIGAVRVIQSAAQMDQVKPGDVLVTDMTDPNWEPVMKRAAAIVTNRGGRTCHAAIIARELGIPAVVGCGDATEKLASVADVTVSCAEGDTGNIYEGRLAMDVETVQQGTLPELPVKIMMNVGNPQLAFDFQALPTAALAWRGSSSSSTTSACTPRRCSTIRTSTPSSACGRGVGLRLRQPARVLRSAPGGRHRHHRRGLLAQAGDRAHVGLQEQRVQEAHRRQPTEPDEENPMLGFAARRATSPTASANRSAWSAPRSSACATTWG